MAIILIAAKDLTNHCRKGDIVEIVDDGHEFGAKEGLPNFIRVTVTDRNATQIENYLERVTRALDYEVLGSNELGARCKIEYAVTGSVPKDISLALEEYVLSGGEQELDVQLFERSPDSLTVDIAIPLLSAKARRTRAKRIQEQNAILKAFRDDINDKFQEVIDHRRWCFSPSDVDGVVNSGGETAATAAQLQGKLVDKWA